MFEWRDSPSFVSVKGSVIRCLGSHEAGAPVRPLCVCVCMGEGICVCVRWTMSTKERVISLSRQSVPGLISSKGSLCW